MTVQQLHPPRVSGLVGVAQADLRQAAEVPAGSVSTRELAEAISRLAELESQATALRLALSAEADRRRVADATADTGTDAWLASLTGDSRAMLAGGLRIARLLQDKYAATREAFAAGQLRLAQVRVIVDAAEQAPAGITAAELTAAEEQLVAKATGAATRSGRPVSAPRLRQLARRMFEGISRDLADRHQADLLGREEDLARRRTWFELGDRGDGTWSGRFIIPELHGHLLKQLLDKLSAPRRWHRGADGATGEDLTLRAMGSLNYSERLGVALCELVEHLPTAGHAGTTTEIVVATHLDTLRRQVGAARLETGIDISPFQVRRLACNAGIIPAVLGSDSLPLDLGRRSRLHLTSQRRALALSYDSCAVTGCERPFHWCEIHHPEAWSEGGTTDLANALPLCWWHHCRAHEPQWDLRRHAQGDWRFHRRT